jgi:Kef-type K+ transport system membrane component KefB
MNFDNLVAVLAVAAAVPLILVAVPRVRVPGPVLEIVAGIVLGPAVLHLVKPDQSVRLVSTIGLAFLLFLAGLEIDVRHFRGPRDRHRFQAVAAVAAWRPGCPRRHRNAPHRTLDVDHEDD